MTYAVVSAGEPRLPRIVFVNRFFHPDHSATSQMLSDLAFALAANGHEIAVITARIGYEAGTSELPSRETISGVAVERVWSSRFGRARLLGRVADYLTFYLSALVCLLRVVRRGDIVVAKTDPPMLSVLVAPVARLKGARLVNWLQDIFPEVAAALGVGNGAVGRVAHTTLRWLRDRSLRRAEANVVLGERMAETVAGMGVRRENIRIICNWADGEVVRPIAPDMNPLRRDWGLQDRFVVGYSGNLGRAHEFETFLEAIADIEHTPAAPAITWLFIGGGVNQAAMMREVVRRGLVSVACQPYQPRDKLGESLSVADVHLVSLRSGLEGLIVPSKIYGVMAAGRPAIFVGDADGEVARTLRANDCGVTVAEGDGLALATAVLRLASQPTECRRQGCNARIGFERHYALPHAVARWTDLVQALQRTGVPVR